jgi:hypothetical protein
MIKNGEEKIFQRRIAYPFNLIRWEEIPGGSCGMV